MAIIAMMSVLAGCSLGPYRYGTRESSLLPKDSELSPPVLVGGPVPAMDRLEKVVNAPRDAIKRWKVDLAQRRGGVGKAHAEATSQDAFLAAMAYLEDNDLHDVIVEVHHHDPFEQWKRLQANPDIHPFWKYSDGAARIGAYAMFPPRVYRFDAYNPYTKTLSVNSDNPAAAIYEAAKAKTHSMAPWPGAYAAMRYVPFAPIGQQVVVTQDALAYVRQNADPTIERAMVSHTFASITGTALLGGSAVSSELNDVPLIAASASRAIGVATGDVAGRLVRPRREKDRPQDSVPEEGSSADSPQDVTDGFERLSRAPSSSNRANRGGNSLPDTIYR